MFSENAERSDVTWGQLAFDTESLGSLQRSNPKVSLVINIVALFPMMTTIVAFLTRLGGFQSITNDANLLFCFLDHIRSKELSFTGYRPVKGYSTSSSMIRPKRIYNFLLAPCIFCLTLPCFS